MKKLLLKAFPYQGLPGPVYILFFCRIVSRMGDFVRFFLTLYLTAVLGYDEKQTGLLITLSVIAVMLGSLVGGRLTDFSGRKKIMLSAQFLGAASIGLCGFYPEARWLLWPLIFSQFFLGAAQPVGSAMVTDLTTREQRQKAMSLLYLGINIGVSIGPVIAGFLFNSYRHWLFWGDALTTLFAVVLVALKVPETMPSEEEQMEASGHERAEDGGVLSALLKRPVLSVFLVMSVVLSFVYSQHTFTLPLQLQKYMGSGSAGFYGIIMSVNAVTVLIVTPLVLRILEHNVPLKNLKYGSLCYAVGFGMLFFLKTNTALFLISTVIWTVGEVIMVTNEGVFVANHTPVNQRGRINGLRNMLYGIGSSITPALSGVFVDSIGTAFIWPLVAALAVIYLAVIAVLQKVDDR